MDESRPATAASPDHDPGLFRGNANAVFITDQTCLRLPRFFVFPEGTSWCPATKLLPIYVRPAAW